MADILHIWKLRGADVVDVEAESTPETRVTASIVAGLPTRSQLSLKR